MSKLKNSTHPYGNYTWYKDEISGRMCFRCKLCNKFMKYELVVKTYTCPHCKIKMFPESHRIYTLFK